MRPAACTIASHEEAKARDWRGSFVRHRRWSDYGLEAAECPACNSTLAIELAGDPAAPHHGVEDAGGAS